MKQVLFIFILSVISTASSAQNTDSCTYEMKGLILDADTKEALPYVLVYIKGTPHTALSGINGEFHIKDLCNQTNQLIFSCLGYCDTTCHNFHQDNRKPHIYLKKELNTLEEVTIVAKKLTERGTASIAQQTITQELLSADPTQTLASALSDIKGVTFTSKGNNVQLPVIHGLNGNRVLILNNGIKHGFQNWGAGHAPEIDVSNANAVTVLMGAAGVRYGPEALGGVILVEADPLYLNEPFKAKIGTGYQTNGKGYFLNAKIGQGLKKWSYHLGANYTRIGDKHTPDYSLTNSGKEEKSISGGLRYHLDNLDFKVYYSYLNQNLAILRSSIASSGTAFVRAINSTEPVFIAPFSFDINEPNQLTQHHLGKVEVNWWYADDAKLTFRLGSQFNKREEYDVRRNADLPIIDLDLITNDIQLEWKHPSWFGLDGLIGLQAFLQNNDNNPGTGTTPFIPNYNTFRYSAFFIESRKSRKGTFELGIRLDYEYNSVRGRETNQDLFTDKYSFTNLTSSLGYVYQISDNATFRTNFGTAWRTPNMAELYSFGQNSFKTSFGLLRYYTNEDSQLRTDKVTAISESKVNPEKGYKWVNELEIEKKTNTYTLTSYVHYIENFIFDRPLAVIGTIRGPMPVFIFSQTDAMFIGADLTWQKRWSSSLDGNFGISYLLTLNTKKNETLINQPPISTSYKLVWKMKKLWKAESSQISFKPSYTFRQFQAPGTIRPEELIDGSVVITPESEIFDFKDTPSGYFLLDIAWQMKFRNFNTGVSIQNIFNTRYRNSLNEMRYFADEPGINLLFTINYKFKSNQK
jgi:iron complex outermembrane receptor protein